MLSQMSVTGMPARASSQQVRRAPCPTGRVSSAYTRATLPCAAAAYTMPSAVPKNTVARLPALQCVRMRAPFGRSAAPCAPMARFAASSSASRAFTASKRAAAASSAPPPARTRPRAARLIRATPQERFTAVGRALATWAHTCSSSER